MRANSSPPVEDVTVIGDMTIDRLRPHLSVDGANDASDQPMQRWGCQRIEQRPVARIDR